MEAAEWDQRYSAQDLVWSVEPNRFVEAETASTPAGRALDVAAGEGRNSIWLAGQGWRVTAVDFSQVGLEKGRRLAEKAGVAERIEWVTADLRTWNPEPGAYDLVMVAYLQLPEDSLRPVLEHMATGLAPGAKMLVVGHDRANLEAGVGGPQDPAVLHTPDGLRSILAGAGLDHIRSATVERPTPAGTALDTLATAVRPEGSPK